jgi:alanine dehydrogenase
MKLQHSDPPPLHVRSEDIEAHVGHAIALAAARRSALALADGKVQTRRATLPFENGWMRLMAAEVSSLGIFGYKEFHLADGGSVRYCIHVFDTASGRPIGIVDAALVTTLRTAATAAVAVEHLVGTGNPVRLGVVGTGAEAFAGVAALNTVAKLDEVRATSRRPANRDAFAEKVRDETALRVTPCESVEEALADVDVVYVATNSGGRVVLRQEQVAQVPVVASIGSTLPVQRELSGEILIAADRVIVDTLDVLAESGDAIEAGEAGWARDSVVLLGDALSEESPAAGPDTRTVYKSIGSPEQDLVLAAAILDAAEANGFGRRVDALSAVKVNL